MTEIRSSATHVRIEKKDFELFGDLGVQTDNRLPAMFLTRFRVGEFEILSKLGIALNEVLHGEQEFIYQNDYWQQVEWPHEISYETVLESQIEKKSSGFKLIFLNFMTNITFTKLGKVCATSKTVMIVRRALR